MNRPSFLQKLFGRKGAAESKPAPADEPAQAVPMKKQAAVPPASESGGRNLLGQYYEVCAVLGRGGFGQVYLVRDRRSDTVSAFKTFRDEFLVHPLIRAQFRLEAEAWIRLGRHPYLVQANYVEEIAGRLYLAMEYVPPDERGRNTLEQHLRSSAADLEQALVWAIQICHGMEHAYRQGLGCHRDLKPGNVMIDPNRNAKITDFGLARMLDCAQSPAAITWDGSHPGLSCSPDGKGFGTPTHMPPEQFKNAPGCDQRSDIYSFGVILFQLASKGRLPFLPATPIDPRGGNAAAIWREFQRLHSREAAPHLDSPLMPIIERCLAKEPSGRHASFEELRMRLESLLKEKTGRTVHTPQPEERRVLDLATRGYSLNRLGRYQEALESYDRAIACAPAVGQPWRGKGAALRGMGRLAEALECFDQAIRINPADASAWSCKGATLGRMGQRAEALVCLDRALEIGPPDADTLCNKANILSDLGRYAEAVACAEQAVRLAPGHAAAWCEKGRGLHALGHLVEAVRCYDQALRIDPYLPVVWFNKGLIAEAQSDLSTALQHHRRFIELAPVAHYAAQIAHSQAMIQRWSGHGTSGSG